MFTTSVYGNYPKQPEPPRPQLLNRALEDFHKGTIDDEGLARAVERATVEVVVEMIAAGVEVVSDGQIKGQDEIGYVCSRLAGFEINEDDADGRPRASSRITWKKPIFDHDYLFLAERAPVEVRLALTGPFSLAKLCDSADYGDDIRGLTFDLAVALNREFEGLANAGAKYILIEEPLLTQYKREIDIFCEAAELLCNGIKADVMLGTFYGDLTGIEYPLKKTPFAGFGFDILEGPDNEQVLTVKDNWEGKIIQLGLVHARDSRVESPMEVALGLIKYAQFHDPDLIWVSPTAGLNGLSRNIAFDKLTNMCQGADWARKEMARREQPGGRIPKDGGE